MTTVTSSTLRRWLVPVVVLTTLAVLGIVFHRDLLAWFGLASPEQAQSPADSPADSAEDSGAGDPSPPPARRGPEVPAIDAPLPPRLAANLETTLAAYEEARDRMADDDLAGAAPHARAIAASLREAQRIEDLSPALATVVGASADAAEALSRARDLESARVAFGDLSKFLVALVGAAPSLQPHWQIYECPMADGFNKWIQRPGTLDNPYMGPSMLTCGSATEWTIDEPAPPADAHVHEDGEIAYYTCPMHPSVRADRPGACPICGMTLTPVTEEELTSGIILVDGARRQRIGMNLAPVARRPLSLSFRAVGEVSYDETRLEDVSLRVTGWVQRLAADETGQRVRRGQVLFTLYSPELFAAQLELLNVASQPPGSTQPSSSTGPTGASAAIERSRASLARAARQRLRLLGMTAAQITELERRGEAWENVPILSPASGYIVEKNVVEGAQVQAGARVFRIADLDRVWIDARVYETDLPHVRVGQPVGITLPHLPGRTYEGTVDFIHPALDAATRTARVRVELPNRELELRPEMYANVIFHAALGERLVVPESAVLYTGARRVVFVEVDGDRLRPVPVEVGVRAEGWYEVLDGLSEGDVVVTSGNFLLASESRLRSGSRLWESGDDD